MSRKNSKSAPVLSTDAVDETTGEVRPVYGRFRTAYDHYRGTVYPCPIGGPSLTKQEFKEQVDINNIVAHFTRTGRLEGFRDAAAQYADLSLIPGSYHENLNLILAADAAFAALPARARAAFNNDVSLFLEAAAMDPEGVFGKRDSEGRIIAPPDLKPSTDAPAPKDTPSKDEVPPPDK